MGDHADGRRAALGIYVIPTVLTTPILLLFAVDPLYAMTEGAFVWTCLLGVVAVVHGAVALGLLTAAAKRRGLGDAARADGMTVGWIYGVAANIVLFQVAWLTFTIMYAVVHRNAS
jgi:hypothetical protein